MTQTTNYGSQWPAPPAPKKSKRWPWILGVLAAFVLGNITGNAGQGSSEPVAQSSPSSSTYAPAAPTYAPPTYAPPTYAPAAAPAAEGITDGTYEVGANVAPGKYRTEGPKPGGFVDMCYWARLKDTSGELGSIIANDNISGPTTITIKPGDGAFETNGCQTWVKVG